MNNNKRLVLSIFWIVLGITLMILILYIPAWAVRSRRWGRCSL